MSEVDVPAGGFERLAVRGAFVQVVGHSVGEGAVLRDPLVYLWLDGKIEKVRELGAVRQKCLVIAYAVHESGRRDVIGVDVGEAETEALWRVEGELGDLTLTKEKNNDNKEVPALSAA